MARRIPALSATLNRSVSALGHARGSVVAKAIRATIGALAEAEALPGPGDYATRFAPKQAYVRRVANANVWLLYRFDEDHVYVMTARDEPPVPSDD